ncbi:MAG: tRNA (adenosine(37)-N6)-threonylcarbamoyltransferase complex dimerization subunit type 1 TsaB [Elusimicrobia bacterium]|nr:tRNA (adenosine(37)-N6)-threonylcarbamoyltransferase complex dimerization subunit type 1 TsaB [Elusimicrobiota bacterium]
MKILTINTTSSAVLELALVMRSPRAEKPVAAAVWARRVLVKRGQDQALICEVERLFRRAHWNPGDLDVIVAANGPGSFTGIRVGMTFAAAAARALERPVVGVSLLEAAAAQAISAGVLEKNERLGVVLEASGQGFFYQQFPSAGKEGSRCEQSQQWIRRADWPDFLRRARGRGALCLVGSGARQALGLLGRDCRHVRAWAGAEATTESLAAIALEKIERGRIGAFQPLYLRPAYYEKSLPRKA